MREHGSGPKIVLVNTYGRWQRGRWHRVRKHPRGLSHKLSANPSEDQYDFGF